jgi:DNA (cytosine-5)-methyltransferase 1
VVDGRGDSIRPQDFIIEAENFGVPQMRHRVILFGVRRDLSWLDHDVLSPAMTGRVSVWQAISGLPLLRSRLSREPDSFESWFQVIREAPRSLKGWRSKTREKIEELMREAGDRPGFALAVHRRQGLALAADRAAPRAGGLRSGGHPGQLHHPLRACASCSTSCSNP